jgi:hypothetical protein
VISSFPEKDEAGATFFENIFASPEGCPIQEILEVVSKFSVVFSHEMNQDLEEEVSEEELLLHSHSMKNGKSPGTGWIYSQILQALL